jgi:hypothetical protein
MKSQDLTFLQVWVEGNQQALEFSVNDRTFQISGIRGAVGLYERFFHESSHPTRRNVGESEMLKALKNATSQLELYRLEKGSGTFFATTADALKAAKEWCGAKA